MSGPVNNNNQYFTQNIDPIQNPKKRPLSEISPETQDRELDILASTASETSWDSLRTPPPSPLPSINNIYSLRTPAISFDNSTSSSETVVNVSSRNFQALAGVKTTANDNRPSPFPFPVPTRIAASKITQLPARNTSGISILPPVRKAIREPRNSNILPQLAKAMNTTRTLMSTAYEKNEYREAINIFKPVKEFVSQQADLITLAGDCYYQLKKYTKAFQNYKAALPLKKCPEEQADLLFKIARTYQKLDLLPLSIEYVKNALQSPTLRASSRQKIMQFLNEVEQSTMLPNNVIQPGQYHPNFQSIVEAPNDNEAMIHLEKGKELLNQKQFSNAVEAFQYGLQFKISASTQAHLLFNLGIAQSELGQIFNSISTYKNALKINIEQNLRAEIIFHLGSALLKGKQFTEAQKLLQYAINTLVDISGNNKVRLCLGLATIYNCTGETQLARHVLNQGIKENIDENNKAKLYLNLARNHFESKDITNDVDCLKILDIGLNSNNKDLETKAQMYILKGLTLERTPITDNLFSAIDNYARAFDLDIHDETKGFICLNWAKALQKSGSGGNEAAIRICQTGLGLNQIHNETRSKLMELMGKLAICNVSSIWQQAALLPNISLEQQKSLQELVAKVNDFANKIFEK